MAEITFADIVSPLISFSTTIKSEKLLLDLIDTPWMQRLREISQTSHLKLVYMFAEHSRFGHSLGVAHLATVVLKKLQQPHPAEVTPWIAPVSIAALLHDIGHLAPGSHGAFKMWFPEEKDSHEELGIKIVEEDPQISLLLKNFSSELLQQVAAILSESPSIPRWTWELISGGGWNVDRGNWSVVDSIMAGVSYGKYNIPALTDSITITKEGRLALNENRLDAMIHFAVSRHAMFRQGYHHRVLLSADSLHCALVKRIRDTKTEFFADRAMRAIIETSSPYSLSLETIFAMRESWWRYHVYQWTQSSDEITKDLAGRVLNRRLFKTIRVRDATELESFKSKATHLLQEQNKDPEYYLHELTTHDIQANDFKNAMPVLLTNGSIVPLAEADEIFNALGKAERKSWLAVPEEIRDAF